MHDLEHLKKIDRLRIAENRDLKNGLRLNRNEKVAPWPKEMLKTIFENIDDDFLSIYPDIEAFSQNLANYLSIKPAEILITNGIDGAIRTIWDVHCSPGDRIGVLSPSYAMYNVYSKIYKTELVEIGYNSDLTLDKKALQNALHSNLKVLFIPNPNQPIESCLDLEEIGQICELAKNTIVVIDEAYFMFGSISAKNLIPKYDNLYILQGFSKGFGLPSIRLGYTLSQSKNIKVLSANRNAYETNSFSMLIANYFLSHPKIITDYQETIISTRKYLKSRLAQINILSYGNFGNYVLIDLKSKERRDFLYSYLLKHKIYVKGEFSGNISSHILITIGSHDQMDAFYECLVAGISVYDKKENR